DTPLLNWFQSNVYASGKYPEQELGDAARLALIWHHGGIYADLDIISVSPISRIGRCIAQDDAVMLNNALLSFPQHDPFILLLMHVFVRDFQGHSWAFNGPWLVTKVYNSLCRLSFDTNEKTDIVTDLHPDIVKQADASCASLVAAIPSRFHPINWRDREVLYKPWNASCEVLHDITRTSIAVHVWRRLPVGLKTPNDSLFVKILENACPNVLLSFTPAEIGIISGTTIQKTVGAFHYLGCFKTSPERQILRTELTSEIDGKMTLE
ncbi:Alpha-1,4-N-acetylglucosaminyltransferase, partial [Entophlyctis luteolus]